MSRTPFALTSLCMLLVGCGVTEESFAVEFATMTCRKARSCEPEDFEDWYDDLDDCVDDTEGVWELVQDGAELFCDIDYQLASRCYRQLKFASCEQWDDEDWNAEACDEYVVCD